jgi:hypothetical protein
LDQADARRRRVRREIKAVQQMDKPDQRYQMRGREVAPWGVSAWRAGIVQFERRGKRKRYTRGIMTCT